MLFRQLFENESSTFTYLLADPETKDAVLIDPVRETFERDVTMLKELGLDLRYTLETHVHADHVTSSSLLREAFGSKRVVSNAGGAVCADVKVADGDVIHFGKHAIEVRATPGHTDGCVTFVTADMKRAFTGDTLLIRGCGRTDFQQGDPQQLYRSVHDQVFSLPDDTEVWPGHDYKGRSMSTVGEEKALNPRLGQGRTEAEFVTIMNDLQLPYPKKMDVAVPSNLRCGLMAGEEAHDPVAHEAWAQIVRSGTGVPEVTPAWLNEHATLVRLVDVREISEFNDELGHIAGAENVPLATVTDVAERWDRETPIAVVCRAGGRSGRAALELEKMGFHRVVSMKGGMNRWVAEDLCSVNRNGATVELTSLSGVRDELFGCFVGMNQGHPRELEPQFKGVFEEVGASFDHPDRQGLEKVLLALKTAAIAKGMAVDEIEPHLAQFQQVIQKVDAAH